MKSEYVFEPMEVMAKHVLERLNPDFPVQVRPGDIVVAGRHFGQSSGRAIATKALMATGIGCVVADTFARFLVEMLEAGGLIKLAARRTDLFASGDRPFSQ